MGVRRKSKFFGGMLAFPGGRVEPDEDPVKAIRREVEEETGYKIDVIESEPLVLGELEIFGKRGLIKVYKSIIVGGSERGQDEEVLELLWTTPSKFLESLKEGNYPQQHVDTIKKILKEEGLNIKSYD